MKYEEPLEGQSWDEADACSKPAKPQKLCRNPFAIIPTKIFTDERLSALDVRVYTVMAGYISADQYCYPHIQTIASKAGCSYRSATRCLSHLEEAGYVVRHSQYRADGGRCANIYYLDLNPSSQPVLSTKTRESYGTGQQSPKDRTPESHLTIQEENKFNFKKLNNMRACARVKGEADAAKMATASKPVSNIEKNTKDTELKKLIKSSANKAAAWVELVRDGKGYALRPVSSFAQKQFSKDDFSELIQFIADAAGGCRPLKFGSRSTSEVII